ncbi:MAG: hypothetical protein JNL58_01110 [Planctomyces sp.]|nr:hypothetical protein [Planctomyces sp.]
MFFRFSAALILIVMVSMTSVMIEKRTLELRRQISRQYYHTDLLIELQVRLRLETQTLTAPSQLADLPRTHQNIDQGNQRARSTSGPERTERGKSEEVSGPRLPLLRFQEPFRPEGID